MAQRFAILVGTLVVGGGACRGEPAKEGRPQDRPVAVEVGQVDRGPIRRVQTFVAELDAPEAVELASKIAGRLRSVRVQLGEAVAAGALLAQIDDASLRAQLDEARAAAQVAAAALRRAEVEDENAAVELGRKEPLAQKDLITQQELDNVRTRRDSAAAARAVARAQVTQAEARIELLNQQVSDARVSAPFAGWVAARYLDAGAVVSPGTPILRLVRTDPAVVRFQIGEREVGEVRRQLAGGLAFAVALDAYPGERFVGRVVRVAPAIDVASRSVAIEGEVANGDGRLMPGMSGRVELDLGTLADAVRLPVGAPFAVGTPDLGGNRPAVVWAVVEGAARRLEVALGLEDQEFVEVRVGLSPGDQVVTRGVSALREGSRLTIVSGAAPPGDAEAKADLAP